MDKKNASPKTVLIVDDEVDIRTFLSTLVKSCGYNPVVAKSWKEGMHKARMIKPDLMIFDVMMSGEAGVLMYRRFKTDELLRDTPVIVLSAISKQIFDRYMFMLAIRLDESIPFPNAYMEKPPDSEELKRIMNSIIS